MGRGSLGDGVEGRTRRIGLYDVLRTAVIFDDAAVAIFFDAYVVRRFPLYGLLHESIGNPIGDDIEWINDDQRSYSKSLLSGVSVFGGTVARVEGTTGVIGRARFVRRWKGTIREFVVGIVGGEEIFGGYGAKSRVRRDGSSLGRRTQRRRPWRRRPGRRPSSTELVPTRGMYL